MDEFHLIGIKGSGMSALAQILHDLGHNVQGEDTDAPLFTQARLEARHIPLHPFGDAPISSNRKAIASNAFDEQHPSIVRCRQQGIPVQRYHHFLGEWMKGYTSIAITGAHGKTTTTGMMAHTLNAIEPTCSLIGDGTGNGFPDARLFVFESCEYRRHFLAYRPDIAVITNIDFDHPDYFTDLDDVRRAFEEMASQTGRLLVACGDDPQVKLLRTNTKTLHYGFGMDNELRASNPVTDKNGVTFEVFYQNAYVDSFRLPAYGNHLVLNALAVIGVALVLDLDRETIKAQLATFTGVKRRFTEKIWDTNILIDDYAHHPTEIRATLESARSKYPNRKMVGIFQPHTFSRLEKFLDDFALSLQGADDVFLCPIFGSARENNGRLTIDDLSARIPGARLVSDSFVSDMSAYRDAVLVFMGAGDIQKYEDILFQPRSTIPSNPPLSRHLFYQGVESNSRRAASPSVSCNRRRISPSTAAATSKASLCKAAGAALQLRNRPCVPPAPPSPFYGRRDEYSEQGGRRCAATARSSVRSAGATVSPSTADATSTASKAAGVALLS